MTKVIYEIVEHDGGFAYRLGDVYSETFPTHRAAHEAAEQAAARQRLEGADAQILYQDADGNWHESFASGRERPDTAVEDAAELSRTGRTSSSDSSRA